MWKHCANNGFWKTFVKNTSNRRIDQVFLPQRPLLAEIPFFDRNTQHARLKGIQTGHVKSTNIRSILLFFEHRVLFPFASFSFLLLFWQAFSIWRGIRVQWSGYAYNALELLLCIQ
jgi:hypothetical protein